MTVLDYLLKFRKISSLESLEKLFDHLNYSLTDTQAIVTCIAPPIIVAQSWSPVVNCSMWARFLNPFGDSCSKAVILHASCLYFPA